ncbi:MAG: BamA/TamA family outer membrane protein [Aureispira sp.]|nr:BamA/TamA family outer membrane protein [Aureispira sp.]
MQVLRLLFLVLVSFSTQSLLAQDSLKLEVRVLDQPSKFLKRWKYKASHPDSSSINAELSKLLQALQAKAYLAASIDTLFRDGNQFTAFLFAGERYEWAHLQNGNVPSPYLNAIGFKERLYSNSPFFYKEVEQLQTKLLQYLENNGFPFATVYLDSIRIGESDIAAKIYMNKGPIMQYKALKVIPNKDKLVGKKRKKAKVRISRKFLGNYLGIREGKLYNENKVRKISNRLRELPYLKVYRPFYIVFEGEEAELNLFLENRNASKIDVLFGLLPSRDPTTQVQRFNFTGNVHIDLLNSFGIGERIQFKWQQLRAGTSDLLISGRMPYIAGLPLGVDAAFKLYVRDSSFINIIADVGVQYLFGGESYIKAFWENTSTRLISVDTSSILQTKRLPNRLDMNNATFGLEFYYEKLDYKFNPRKGFESQLTAGFGIKTIRKNQAILAIKGDGSFDYNSLYDSIQTRSFVYQFDLSHSHFFGITKWSTIMARIKSGLIVSKNPIYENELYRIGGNKLLRGFDEESIFASWYNILTLEWRFLFGTNSYAYVFGDVAYTQNKSIDNDSQDWPYGFGIGVALETKVGIFGLSYALGAQQGNPILFQNGKVHFGYIFAF